MWNKFIAISYVDYDCKHVLNNNYDNISTNAKLRKHIGDKSVGGKVNTIVLSTEDCVRETPGFCGPQL
jgi:hypothetical protein